MRAGATGFATGASGASAARVAGPCVVGAVDASAVGSTVDSALGAAIDSVFGAATTTADGVIAARCPGTQKLSSMLAASSSSAEKFSRNSASAAASFSSSRLQTQCTHWLASGPGSSLSCSFRAARSRNCATAFTAHRVKSLGASADTMFDRACFQLTRQFQQLGAALLNTLLVGGNLQGENQVLQRSAIAPLSAGVFRTDKITQRRCVLTRFGYALLQLIFVVVHARAQPVDLRLNGPETTVEFGQFRKKRGRHGSTRDWPGN